MDEVQIIETSKRTEKLRGRGGLLRTKEEFQLAKGTTFLDEVVGQGAQPADVRRAFAIYEFLPLLDPKLKIPGDYKEWHFHAPNYEGTEKPLPASAHVSPLTFRNMQRGIAEPRAENLQLKSQLEKLRNENQAIRKNTVSSNALAAAQAENIGLKDQLGRLTEEIEMIRKIAIFPEDLVFQESLKQARALRNKNALLILLELQSAGSLTYTQLQSRVVDKRNIFKFLADAFQSNLIRPHGQKFYITAQGKQVLKRLGLI